MWEKMKQQRSLQNRVSYKQDKDTKCDESQPTNVKDASFRENVTISRLSIRIGVVQIVVLLNILRE
jgi:hypothetical protein